MGLSRALLRGAAASSATGTRLAARSTSSSSSSSSSLFLSRPSSAASASERRPWGQEQQQQQGQEDEAKKRRRPQQQQQQQPLPQLLNQQRRAFHASRRQENPILIGVVIVVGATLARYVYRAARRVSKEESKGAGGGSKKPDDADGHDTAGGSAHHAAAPRGFPVLGLDVGTLHSCVAFAPSKTGAPLVVENHEGRRSTPAFVAFEDGAMVVGQLARRARWRDPARVAFNLPRLLGQSAYDDALRPLFPFPVDPPKKDGDAGGLMLGLGAGSGGGRAVSSGEAAARLLEDLVQTAEHKAHKTPRFAVLAVPSFFDAAAKARALAAAQEGTGLGGDGAVEVIEDAIATLACACYTGRVTKEEAFLKKPWLVCDVGGLNAQVSVVQLDPEHGLVVRGQGTSWLVGGEQLDGALVRFLVEDFKRKQGGIDLGADYLALERLHEAAEAAKVELSSKVASTVRLPFITADHRGPKHLDATLSRAQLENLAAPLLDHLKEPFTAALKQAGLGPQDLQGLILSGGTARLPFVPTFVAGLAKPAELPLVVLEAPEEAAALGSAYFGRELVDDEEGDDDDHDD